MFGLYTGILGIVRKRVGGASGAPLDGISGLTGAWSTGRNLLTSYNGSYLSNTSGNCDTWYDQSGSARNFTRATAAARPLIGTGGGQNRAWLDVRPQTVDGTNDSMESVALSNFISNTEGYFIVSFIPDDAARTNFAAGSISANDALFGDTSNIAGIYFQNGSAVGGHHDGSVDVATGHAVTNGTGYVIEWWHTGGSLNTRLNGGTTNTVASGNTSALTGLLRIGAISNQADFKIFEMAAFSTVPSGTVRDSLVTSFRTWSGA